MHVDLKPLLFQMFVTSNQMPLTHRWCYGRVPRAYGELLLLMMMMATAQKITAPMAQTLLLFPLQG